MIKSEQIVLVQTVASEEGDFSTGKSENEWMTLRRASRRRGDLKGKGRGEGGEADTASGEDKPRAVAEAAYAWSLTPRTQFCGFASASFSLRRALTSQLLAQHSTVPDTVLCSATLQGKANKGENPSRLPSSGR